MNFYGVMSGLLFYLMLPFWLILGVFNPKLTNGLKEKMGNFDKKFDEKTIIFYGISVGEVTAMENLIKKTREKFPNKKIIILTGTKTGQEIAHKKLDNIADFITYFPLDFPQFVKKSFTKLNPEKIFVMETELWPNYPDFCRKNNIDLYIINGRISDRTYTSYKKLSFFFKPILRNFTGIFTQCVQDNKKLISIGANPDTTTIMGNLKFDIKPKESNLYFGGGNSRIIVAGSTHTGEDEIILNCFKDLRQKYSDIKLLIAPRHPERNENVYEMCKKTSMPVGKRSENASFDNTDIILLNSMGELSKAYSLCYFAIIGGSFNKTGGHNPLEATIYNKPTISGPSIHNFKDIYALLSQTYAGKVLKDKNELEKYMEKLLSDNEFYEKSKSDCTKIFKENCGALNFVLDIISK